MKKSTQKFLKDIGVKIPIVCGPMYPGSNPELVAAVSDAGGFGVVQPLALTSLYGHDFREGLTAIITVKVMEPQFEVQTKTLKMKMSTLNQFHSVVLPDLIAINSN